MSTENEAAASWPPVTRVVKCYRGRVPPPRVFLCVSIDCECDKGPAWRTRRPMAFDGVHVGLGERLQPLFERYGAKPTYLISPELLRDAASIERLASLRGCELGTHLHGELAEPGAFAPDVTNQMQRDYPREVERAKLTWLTNAFRTAFGRAPGSFRAGRFGIGRNTIALLEQLGYVVESSVTPYVDWSSVSPGLTFVGAPTQPYHPDPEEPGRPGVSAILEVPVTIRPRRLGRLPVVGRLFEPRWLRPTHCDARALVAVARAAIVDALLTQPTRPIVLNAMLHNVEVVAGASPYAQSPPAASRIVDRLGGLLEFAAQNGIECVGLSDVPEVLAA